MKVRLLSGLVACVLIALALMTQPTANDALAKDNNRNFSWSQTWNELRGEVPEAQPTLNPTSECRNRIEVGNAVSGKKIYACEILGSSSDAPSPLLVIGTMHGDEPAGQRVTERLIELQALTGSSIWVVKNANPDGTKKMIRQNANGVDINRNFPEQWEASAVGTRMYSGPAAASEPETRALMLAINEIAPKRVIIFHQPYDQVDCVVDRSDDFGRALAELTGVKFQCIGGEMSGSLSNEFTGTFTMWIHKHFSDTTAVTFEMGFDPSAEAINTIAKAIQVVAQQGPF